MNLSSYTVFILTYFMKPQFLSAFLIFKLSYKLPSHQEEKLKIVFFIVHVQISLVVTIYIENHPDGYRAFFSLARYYQEHMETLYLMYSTLNLLE